MDKKNIILLAAGVGGVIVLARMMGKKEAEITAPQIPEGPKPGKKVEGQKSLRGQFLNFFKELKDLGYFNSDDKYKEIIDMVIEIPDEKLKENVAESLMNITFGASSNMFGPTVPFKESAEKDVKEAVIRFAKNNKINLEAGLGEFEDTTGRFQFGRGRRFGTRMPLWRQLRPLRMKRCPYAVGEDY